MKNILKKTLGLAAAGTMLAAGAFAVNVDNDATVDIVAPLNLTAADDMDFGKVFLANAANNGTIVIAPTGILGATSNVSIAGGTTSQGSVDVSAPNASSIIFNITDAGGEANLSLSNFTARLSGTTLTGDGNLFNAATLTTDGDDLEIGATLNITSGITAGDNKTPTYNVDAIYQ